MVAALSELAGIEAEDIEVKLDSNAFTISYDPDLVGLEAMYSAITELGYRPGMEDNQSRPVSDDASDGIVPEPIAAALALAARENKLIFIDFYAEWCLACKALEQQTLSDADVTAVLDGFLSLKIDTDQYPQAASFYAVVGMPTLLVIDSEGIEQFRSVGMIEAQALARQLRELSGKEFLGK